MLSITRRHTISLAHRLYDYEGKCERLHGHNYVIELTLTRTSLDALGMIVDFTRIKKVLLQTLDAAWDHRTLLYQKDPLSSALADILTDGSVCRVEFNPTAENMAQYLGATFFPKVLHDHFPDEDLAVTRITVYETPDNSATWER